MSVLPFAAVAFIAGLIQSVTGFGAGVTMVLFLSGSYSMAVAPAINTAVCLGLTSVMTWKHRKWIKLRMLAIPATAYALISVAIINVVDMVNLDVLEIIFGLFLMALSAFFLFFSDKVRVKANLPTALVCGALSGVFSGLFSVGGPVMGLYLVTVSESHEEYLANTQVLFMGINIVNLAARMVNGQYTPELLPLTLAGILAINVGALAGGKVYHKLNIAVMKKIVYAYVGISGATVLAQCMMK